MRRETESIWSGTVGDWLEAPRRRFDWRYVGSYLFVVGLVLLQAVFFCWGTLW